MAPGASAGTSPGAPAGASAGASAGVSSAASPGAKPRRWLEAWRGDRALRAILRNAGLLVSGKGAGALLHLLGLAVAARALGPDAFGVLVLINTYALTASGLARFQSWQAIIQFGTPALHRIEHAGGHPQELADVLLFALVLDLGTGVLGMLGAMALLPFLGERLGIPEALVPLCIAYATLVPTMTIATPSGVLRLLDRFDLMAWQSLTLPGLRLAGVLLCWGVGLPFWAYVLCWWASDLAGDLVLGWVAWRELGRRGLRRGVRVNWRAALRPGQGIWPFVWFANLGSSLGVAWGPLSNLVVGALLGPAAAGFYRVAQTVVDALGKPAELLARVFYPEAARLREAARTAEFWRLSTRSAALAALGAGAVMLIVMAAAGPFMRLAFGANYAEAAPLLAIMAASLLATVPAFPLEPLLLTLGRAGTALLVRAVVTLLYLGVLWFLAATWGLPGAALAYVLGSAAMAATMLAAVAAMRRGARS
ncbi:lipopolysaccharide biosynthesis protein [Roseomonas sp. BN140053]|uniref:lipopolysaccharide biosynthesis protein n=1 Tax=Roseomonas sp. BN140053 TaxID=3391898 RepID=UPI0039EC9A75